MRKNRRKKLTTSRSKRSNRTLRSSFLIKRLKYFPAIAITIAATFIWSQPQLAFWSKNHGVLAYATNVSNSGLLSATNAERSAHGVSSLAMNSRLQSAAQAKANDMVSRNYWSHQTPDGKQPWVFITNAGYSYLSAGENLAYGFMSSSATVTGWMNSPPHRQNLLSGTFTEVGFGIANSSNYVNNGPQTIVVAMYGKPQVLAATPANPKPTPPKQASTPKPKSAAQESAKVAPKEIDNEAEKEAAPAEKTEHKDKKLDDIEPIAIAASASDDTPKAGSTQVQRVQVLTGGSAIWSAAFVILGVCAIGILWLIHRGFRFRYWLKASEKFLGKHLYLDLTVLAVIYLGFVLLSNSGTIR